MKHRISRRDFMKMIAAVSSGISFTPQHVFARSSGGVAAAPGRSPAPEAIKPDLTYLDPVAIEVDRRTITLRSRPDEVTDCRSALYWRPGGGSAWVDSRGEELLNATETGERRSFTVLFDGIRADIALAQLLDGRLWRFSGTITNRRHEPIEVARFHYLDGTVSSRFRFLELAGARNQPGLRSGGSSLSPHADAEDFWSSVHANWPEMGEPIHDQAGWFVSTDIAALVEGWNRPGWGFGFVGPGNAFGEIGYLGLPKGARVFLGVLMDGVHLDPGKTRALESAVVWHGDWQSGLNVWARLCADEYRAPEPAPPLVGYCSWHQKQTRIAPTDIEAATREFSSWPVPRGRRVIQIDDGFQVQPGDWDPNSRFRTVWPGLAHRIAATGSLPGLWLSPTAVHETHPIVRENSDWLQRLSSGEPAIWLGNWGKTYFLEPDHPEVRDWIRALLRRFSAEGWKYFKLDFTYVITSARRPYDPRKTRFQTLRDLYALIHDTLGPEVLINACIGTPSRYALGHAGFTRLGSDMTPDFGAVKLLVRQILSRTCTHGVWWQGDPDAFTMYGTRLSAEEKRVLTGTAGLFGGLFLTADLPSQWSHDEAAFVRRFWNSLGPRTPRSHYVVWNSDGEVTAYRVSFDDGRSPDHSVGLYNWGDIARETRVSLSETRLDSAALRLTPESASQGASMSDGEIRIPHQPAHSLRIVDLVSR